MTRRMFVSATAAAAVLAGTDAKPALLGGTPVRRQPFPAWPKTTAADESAWMEALRSKKWFRGDGKRVDTFEARYAELMGAKHCVATANGTSALFASLAALGVEPGDEIIVPPYTFVATINVVLLHHALPVFVDTDPETFQIDARKIDAAINGNTRVLLPVHLGGSAADMDSILATGKNRGIPVLEDACQAVLGEWRGRKLSTLGAAGCFSFQASKNLNSGEGGAILTNDGELAERCFAFHNNGRGRKVDSYHFQYTQGGANLRMTEFQAALLMTQMARLEEQSKLRAANAEHLTSLLREIPGIHPARMYDGCTRNAYHLYMFRYDKEHFAGLSREAFMKALDAEGVPTYGGYVPLNKEPFLENTLKSRSYQKLFSKQRLAEWRERTECPANDKLCTEAVWFMQTMLLDTREGMEQIAEAIRKIQAHAPELARTNS